ncbi:MAG: peptidoglycan bridge formation glycyltransferase FemA/FemB family protein [Chloroflexota bacterium]
MPGEIWNEFVSSQSGHHVLQTKAWGELKRNFGWDYDQVLLQDDAGAQVLYRWFPSAQVPITRWASMAYIPKGPLVDWNDPDKTESLLSSLIQRARQNRAILLRLEPALEYENKHVRELLVARGFQESKAIQPQRTLVVDISGDEDSILSRMKSKTRYNIRLARRKGITVRLGDSSDVHAFSVLMLETGNRAQFGVHSEEYYRAAWELFAPNDHVALLLAEYEGELLAGIMVFAVGNTAWYFYGASSHRHRQLMPTYLLQWEGIRWAKSRNCTLYDLWGVPDADEEELEARFTKRSDGLWGVYRFKRGFGGELVRWMGAYDLVLNPVLYSLAAPLLR